MGKILAKLSAAVRLGGPLKLSRNALCVNSPAGKDGTCENPAGRASLLSAPVLLAVLIGSTAVGSVARLRR